MIDRVMILICNNKSLIIVCVYQQDKTNKQKTKKVLYTLLMVSPPRLIFCQAKKNNIGFTNDLGDILNKLKKSLQYSNQ